MVELLALVVAGAALVGWATSLWTIAAWVAGLLLARVDGHAAVVLMVVLAATGHSGAAVAAACALWYGRVSYWDGSERDGRREWPAFRHRWERIMSAPLRRYLRYRLTVMAPTTRIAADRRVLVCFHPHGLFAAGAGLTMLPLPSALPFLDGRMPRLAVHWLLFRVPGVRDLLLWYGCVDARWPTIDAQLRAGAAVGLVPGGVHEMTHRPTDGVGITHTGFLSRAYASSTLVVPCVVHGETEVCYIFNPAWPWLQTLRQWTYRWLRYPLPTFFMPRPPWLMPGLHACVGAAVDPRRFEREEEFRAAYATAVGRLTAEKMN